MVARQIIYFAVFAHHRYCAGPAISERRLQQESGNGSGTISRSKCGSGSLNVALTTRGSNQSFFLQILKT